MSEAQPPTSTNSDPRQSLEKALGQRPPREELIERNILPNSNIAPALLAAQKELQRSQLEDSLENKLKNRPNAAELIKEGILEGEAPPS